MRKSLILLGILDDSDVDWAIRAGVKENVPRGATLIQQGAPLSSLYIVLTGSFAVYVSGAKDPIAKLLPGEILGEMSFVDSRPPSATVIATEDSWVLDIPRQAVYERLEDQPAFAGRFYRALAVFLSNRLRDTTSHLGYGKALQLDESVEDDDEVPEEILDMLTLAGKRFSILQERPGAWHLPECLNRPGCPLSSPER